MNAVCLMTGEILCLQRKNDCCQNMPGIYRYAGGNNFLGGDNSFYEGELTYHARVCEGSACAFIVPSTSEIYLIHEGRICKRESFYKNNLGETYKKDAGRKFDKFVISEESGGIQSRN